MCLVLGCILGSLAGSRAPLLSSKTVQCTFGGRESTSRPFSLASWSIPIMGMTSLKLMERAMYSASVVDIAVIVCILETHVMGAPAKRMSQPERDLDVIGSIWASHFRQLPAKSVSTQHSNCRTWLGRIVPGGQKVSPNALHRFCMAPFWVLRKACALVHADGNIWTR